MNIIKSLKNFIASKALQALSLTGHAGTFQSLLGSDFRFGTQSKDFLRIAYGVNPYVFQVIDRICQRLVQIDKRLLDKAGKEIDNPAFQELLANPNHKEDGSAFLYRAAATYLATGEAFIIRHQELGEDDQYFVPVNYNVTINQDTKGNVLDYSVSAFGTITKYFKSEVLHLFKPDITQDTNHGFSTLRATRVVWESNNEVWKSEAALHKNKGVAGVLYSDGGRPMEALEQKALQEKYDQDNTGDSFGKVKVTTAKLGYIRMGMNPADLKSIETRIEHLRTICASFNVDSKLFGDPAASTYNNMAEAKRAFIMDAVLPLSKILLPKIVEFMGVSVLNKSFNYVLDEDNIPELLLSKEQKSVRIAKEVKAGILTPEEARDMLYPELTKV